MLKKEKKRQRRHKKIRTEIAGTADRPRVSVYRSNKHTYGQLIDDNSGDVLVAANDMEVDAEEIEDSNRKVALAFEVGKLLAKKAQKEDLEEVVFDRSGYKYHGRVKALAEGMREGGLKL